MSKFHVLRGEQKWPRITTTAKHQVKKEWTNITYTTQFLWPLSFSNIFNYFILILLHRLLHTGLHICGTHLVLSLQGWRCSWMYLYYHFCCSFAGQFHAQNNDRCFYNKPLINCDNVYKNNGVSHHGQNWGIHSETWFHITSHNKAKLLGKLKNLTW